MLGKFDLQDIPPAPRGVPQIEVTFQIDENGILTVMAEDKGSGSQNSITITNDQNRLTPEDIDRMINDAERFAEEDKLVRERVESKNELESYTYSLKTQVNDEEKLGSKLSEEEKQQILTVVEEAIEWLDANPEAEAEEFKAKKKEVEDVANPIISRLYQQAGGAPPPEGGEEYDDYEKDEL